jgi:hypothetical protein
VTNNMVIVPHPPYHFVSQIENKTEGMAFWNSVWHPKGITSSTQQH